MPAEIPDGAVVLARAILESPIWGMKSDDIKVALTLIALCNFQPAKWHDGRRETTIAKGEFIRSREGFAKKCKLPVQVVRTCLRRLANAKDDHGIPFVVIKSTSRWTRYTLPRYEFYQNLRNYEDKANPTSNPTSRLGEINQPIHENQPAPLKPTETTQATSKAESSTSKPQPNQRSAKKRARKPRNLTTNKNNKQECKNKKPTPSPPKAVSEMIDDYDRQGERLSNGSANLLNQVSIRRGVLLLLSIGVKKATAESLAGDRPIGEIIDVVQVARTKNSPSGFAIRAIQRGYGVPVDEAARAQILGDLEADQVKASRGIKALTRTDPRFERGEGESETDWLKRVMEMKRGMAKKT